MTTEEGKIFSKFIGWSLGKLNVYVPSTMGMLDGGMSVFYDELKFDKSWEWLMLIVKKIEKLPKEVLYKNNADIRWDKTPSMYRGALSLCFHPSISTNRKEVYVSALEFIEWYNTHCNGKTSNQNQ